MQGDELLIAIRTGTMPGNSASGIAAVDEIDWESLCKCAENGQRIVVSYDLFLEEVKGVARGRSGSVAIVAPAPMASILAKRLRPRTLLSDLSGLPGTIGIVLEGNCSSLARRPLPLTPSLTLKLALLIMPRPLRVVLAEPARLAKFGLVGLTGMAVNMAVASLAYRSFSLVPWLARLFATLIGFEASVAWNFTIHDLWTFRDLRSGSALSRLLGFHVASLASLMMQVAFTQAGPLLGLGYEISLGLGIVVGFITNYLVSRFYAWGRKRRSA
ncbi:MAG: GtrA family protein [Desulfurococcaceae archaeon]